MQLKGTRLSCCWPRNQSNHHGAPWLSADNVRRMSSSHGPSGRATSPTMHQSWCFGWQPVPVRYSPASYVGRVWHQQPYTYTCDVRHHKPKLHLRCACRNCSCSSGCYPMYNHNRLSGACKPDRCCSRQTHWHSGARQFDSYYRS